MQPNNLIMYLVDNNIILYKDKLITEKTKNNIIINGKVAKPQEFYKSLEKILKKYKLNKGIINNNITVLVDPTYTQADTQILSNILDKLSFNKINFINVQTLLEIKKNKNWLIINKNYMYLIHINYNNKVEPIFIDFKLFKNNLNHFIDYLLIFIKSKKLILIGNYDNLEELATKIENKSKTQVYYIEDTINYYINNIKNTFLE